MFPNVLKFGKVPKLQNVTLSCSNHQEGKWWEMEKEEKKRKKGKEEKIRNRKRRKRAKRGKKEKSGERRSKEKEKM